MKITLDQFCAQWVEAPGRMPLASRLDYNVCDFTTQAGAFSRRFFQMSFAAGGFYASGERWKPRTSRWGKRFTHPVLDYTGKLKGSIKGEIKEKSRGKLSASGNPAFKKSYAYEIDTTALTFSRKHRNSISRAGKGYAAIHNTDPKVSPYTVNQYSMRKPVQRQFIGFSGKLDNYINTHYVPMIFKGFPK